MISIEKLAQPIVLQENAIQWRDDLIATIGSGASPTKAQKNRYNQPEVKTVLVAETCGKCAFCESKIRHIDDGDIEHFIPKRLHPEFSFDWANLTLACTICNRNKGEHFAPPGDPLSLVNPYDDDPSDHFLFHREILTGAPESLRGINTEQILDLNRGELRERRREKIDQLHEYITAYAQADEGYKPLVARQIKRHCVGRDKEYSAFLREYISEMITRATLPNDILE